MTIIAGRYKVTGSSLVGGMAAVWPCQDTILERTVAIKVMPGGANRRRVLDEISALLKMRSKHVVQVYDVLKLGQDDLGIVQEFIVGVDLLDPSLVPKTSIEYLKLVWQIASGISDIHSVDVIHRDIKPNNMKLDGEGVIKIIDFGLARDEGPAAATRVFIGTRGFAAPELYPDDATFTAAVDVYAFGATALYLGFGRIPADLMRQPPKSCVENYFHSLPFPIAKEVREILHACLDGDADSRPTMKQVRDLLAKHLLFDRHKALIVFNGTPSYLDSANRSVILQLPGMGSVEIRYDSFCFRVHSVAGDVYINNARCVVNDILPGACVVTLGAPEHKQNRKYITFDLSHPEIVL